MVVPSACAPMAFMLSIAERSPASISLCVSAFDSFGALPKTSVLFSAARRLVSAAFWFGAAARVLAAVSFCAATVCDASVTVDKLVLFSAAILASAAAAASAAVPVVNEPVTPVAGLVQENVALGPKAKRLAANASLNDNGLVVVAAFAAMAASKSPNSVSTTGVVTAGVVTTVLSAPVSTTGVVTAVPVSTVLRAPVPVPMLLTF